METTVKVGWLKDSNGEKFAPKTLVSQVQTNDGALLDDIVASIEESLDTKTIKGTKITNSDVAYAKDVPENSAGYAKIGKIGGMTRKCTNLWPHGNVVIEDRESTISYTLKPGTYTISVSSIQTTDTESTACLVLFRSGGSSEYYVYLNREEKYKTFTVDNKCYDVIFYSSSDASKSLGDSATYENIMLNEGSTALPYEPYFDGLRDAPVTEVESVGVNLIGGEAMADLIVNASESAIKDKQTQTILFYAREANGIYFLACPKPNTQYTIFLKGYTYSGDSARTETNLVVEYTDGTTNIIPWSSPQLNIANSTVYVTSSNKSVKRIRGNYNSGATVLWYQECGVFEGVLSAEDFKPYRRNTLPIPEAVRNLDGYGWGVNDTVYNYIDFEKKQYVQNVRKVKFTGTETWYTGVTDNGERYFARNLETPTTGGLTVGLNNKGYVWTNKPPRVKIIYFAGVNSNEIYIYPNTPVDDNTYSTVDDWKNLLATWASEGNHLTILYPIEPVITDISQLLPSDSIPAEAGGTVTMVNEYGYDVPSTIDFYEDINEIVEADTFVGDLVGTAGRAIADENGNRIDVTAYAPAGFGLGTRCVRIDTWRAELKNGWYTSTGDSPDGTLWAGFVTNDPNTGFMVQRVWRMHNNIMRECIRYFYAGTYLDWEYVNPPMNVDVEYRTTERWMGKPVYTKLVDCDVITNGGEYIPASDATTIIRHIGYIYSASAGYRALPIGIPSLSNYYATLANGTINGNRIYAATDTKSDGLSGQKLYIHVWYVK